MRRRIRQRRQGSGELPSGFGWRQWSSFVPALLCLFGGQAPAQESGTIAGDLAALRNEARFYEHGEGVRKDAGRAIRLYCEAARKGDAEAQFSLGWIYANGRGVPRDDTVAAYYFQLAAKQEHSHAQRMLAYVGPVVAKAPECMRGTAVDEILAAEMPARKQVVDLVLKLAPEYGVYPRLALAVIRTESNFNSVAVSPKNAQGLMQLIPETAVRFKVAKPFDPEQNIRGGLAYLRWLLAYFKGNVVLVAAAYNAGEGAVNRFRGVPPFAETQGFVRRIRELYDKDEHPYDPSVTAPSPEFPRLRLTTPS